MNKRIIVSESKKTILTSTRTAKPSVSQKPVKPNPNYTPPASAKKQSEVK